MPLIAGGVGRTGGVGDGVVGMSGCVGMGVVVVALLLPSSAAVLAQ